MHPDGIPHDKLGVDAAAALVYLGQAVEGLGVKGAGVLIISTVGVKLGQGVVLHGVDMLAHLPQQLPAL